MTPVALPSSFRDPSGFVYRADGQLYRQINPGYADHYQQLMGGGLYDDLAAAGLLIPHVEVAQTFGAMPSAWRVLRPEEIPFVSYPYEWCFSQLQDAAATTLTIARRALEHGMMLKDASGFNIQFRRGRPILIDSLSFQIYAEGAPWVAYRQFCQHFLAPLLLMSAVDVRLGRLLAEHLDGIPLDLASRLLPRRTHWQLGPLLHVHWHARNQRRYARREPAASAASTRRISRTALLGLFDSLERLVRSLKWQAKGTEWWDYETRHNYSDRGMAHKQALVREYLGGGPAGVVWDLGANTGDFSRIAAETGNRQVLAFDADPAAVERHYRALRSRGPTPILPLVMDLVNPSPALGWDHAERLALAQRGPAGTVLALALVHHLALSNNVPLPRLAAMLAGLGRRLVVEFVPKSDSQVQKLLASRKDVFPDYTTEGFERAFSEHFMVRRRERIVDSDRDLYLLERR